MDNEENFIKNNMVGDLGHRTLLFTQLLRSAYRIDTWCFGYDGKAILFNAASEHKEILQTFLEISGGLDYIMSSQDIQRPIFFSDALGCVWVGEWTDPAKEFGNLLFVLGPVMYGANTLRNLDHALSKLHYSKLIREALLAILEDVPVIEPNTFMSLGVMLHCILTGEEISMADCVYQSEHTAGRAQAEEDEEDSSHSGYEQSAQTMETLLMRIVREGNVEGAKRYHGKKWLGRPLEVNIQNPMRDMQDTLIVFIALCSRAAIEGGLPVRMAKTLEQQYMSAVEATHIPTSLTDLSMKMFLDFTQRVRNVRSGPQLSKPILDCCAYIQANLLGSLDLKTIANEIGYSEYYLTKKFAAEMGMKLGEYIKRQRVEYAKILLASSNKSVQEVSDLLRFSSRNYFSAVFQSIEGVTPAAYRDTQTKQGGDQ